jgi:hypothetical protein
MSATDVWALHEQLRARNPSSLTANQRLVLAFGEVRTEVNSGGFDSYFRYYSHARNAPLAAGAARLADCPALAEIIDTAIALIGSDVLRLGDQEAIADRLEQLQQALEDLDRRFYHLEATTDLDAAQARLAARLRS